MFLAEAARFLPSQSYILAARTSLEFMERVCSGACPSSIIEGETGAEMHFDMEPAGAYFGAQPVQHFPHDQPTLIDQHSTGELASLSQL